MPTGFPLKPVDGPSDAILRILAYGKTSEFLQRPGHSMGRIRADDIGDEEALPRISGATRASTRFPQARIRLCTVQVGDEISKGGNMQ